MTRSPAIAVIIMFAAACDPFDDNPDWYVQGLKPDLYYVREVPSGARAASVWFTTTKPKGQTLPINVDMVTWSWPGGNIYDDTLGHTRLEPIDKGNGQLRFSGIAVFPPFGGEAIGVEIRTFLDYVAYEAPPQTGGYCDVDIMGPGILDCGEWIHAILQLWVQCRGIVGQLVPCEKLQSVLVPKIHTVGVRTDDPMATEYPFLDSPHLLLYAGPDGWRYRAPILGFRRNVGPTAAYGPFPTAEDAALDAVTVLGLPSGDDSWSEVVEMAGADTDIGRAAALLHDVLGPAIQRR